MQETASSPWGESYAISFHSGTFGVLKGHSKGFRIKRDWGPQRPEGSVSRYLRSSSNSVFGVKLL